MAQKRTTVTMEAELHEKILKMATETRRTLNNQILYLIDQGIKAIEEK